MTPTIVRIPVDKIDPSPWQPRTQFDEEALTDLAESIQATGLIQPITVRVLNPDGTVPSGLMPTGPGVQGIVSRLMKNGYRAELVSGERRLRAYRILNAGAVLSTGQQDWRTIPCLLSEHGDEALLQQAWDENESRQDLSPMDRARFLARLVAPVEGGGLGMTHKEVGERLRLTRATVSNILRLLQLPERAQVAVSEGMISERAARVLVTAQNEPAEVWETLAEVPYVQQGVPRTVGEMVDAAAMGASAEDLRKALDQAKQCVARHAENAEAEAARAAKSRKVTVADLATLGLDIPPENLRPTGLVTSKEQILYEVPPGCTKNCACRSWAVGYTGKVYPVCQDPKQATKKRNARANAVAAKSREREAWLLERFNAELVQPDGSLPWSLGIASVLLEDAWRHGTQKVFLATVDALEAHLTEEQATALRCLRDGAFWANRKAATEVMYGLGLSLSVRLLAEVRARIMFAEADEDRALAFFAAEEVSADTPPEPEAVEAPPEPTPAKNSDEWVGQLTALEKRYNDAIRWITTASRIRTEDEAVLIETQRELLAVFAEVTELFPAPRDLTERLERLCNEVSFDRERIMHEINNRRAGVQVAAEPFDDGGEALARVADQMDGLDGLDPAVTMLMDGDLRGLRTEPDEVLQQAHALGVRRQISALTLGELRREMARRSKPEPA